jgi:hypothetical protein
MFVVAVAMQSRERTGLVHIFPDLRQGPILVGTVAYVVAPVRLVGVEHILKLPDDVNVEWAELVVTVNSVFQLIVYYKNVLD